MGLRRAGSQVSPGELSGRFGALPRKPEGVRSQQMRQVKVDE